MSLPNDSACAGNFIPVPVAALTSVLEALLTKKSMFAFDAKVVVQRLLEADCAGQPECGVARVVDLLKAIDLGDIDPRGRVLSVIDKPAFAVLDGSRAAGPVAGTKGIELAIKKARECGTGTVAVGNSQWLGSCGSYARLAAQEGILCFCCTSTGKASVAEPLSSTATVGNHGLAWGIPLKSGSPVVIDTSAGVISAEALDWLQRLGLPIPAGVSVEYGGQVFQARGGEFGWGMSLLCGVLAGPLAGGRMPLHKQKPVPSANDSEHFFYAIDVSQFADVDKFEREVQSTLAELRTSVDSVPLQRSLHSLSEVPAQIPLPNSVEQELRERATKHKLEIKW